MFRLSKQTLFIDGKLENQEIHIDKFGKNPLDVNIMDWANKIASDFQMTTTLTESLVGDISVVIGIESDGISSAFIFKKGENIYVITCVNVEIIKEIIINGEW